MVITRCARQSERIEEYETVRVTKSGERKHISLTFSPIRDEDGRIVGASAFGRDITANKRTEERLRESAHQLEVILSGVTDGITAMDRNGRLVFANLAAARLSGFETVDVVANADAMRAGHKESQNAKNEAVTNASQSSVVRTED